MNSPPALPPGFEINPLSAARKKRDDKRKSESPAPLVVSGAVDGDTVKTQGGPNARLYGADAFEIEQNALIGGQSVPTALRHEMLCFLCQA
ncbi:MAG: hypothetical protein IPH79_09185 [Sphingomonadales bacterium]|nr:hypothetical protein [Sphingomonadales bacterium]